MEPDADERAAILARVDLAALADELLRRGHNGMWSCPNPSHTQSGLSPPLSVFVGDDGIPRWHCFGCDDGGAADDLLLRCAQARQGGGELVSESAPLVWGRGDALAWLATRTGAAPPTAAVPATRRRPLRDLAWDELDMFSYVKVCAALLRQPRAAGPRRWLTQTRAIPDNVLDTALVGFDPGDGPRMRRQDGIPRAPAIVVPIREPDARPPGWRVIYTLHRVLKPRPGHAKWLNTHSGLARNPGVGFFDPPRRTRSRLVVTEGPMDALSALAAGYRGAAVLGAGGVNLAVARRLAATGEPLVLAFDNDEAGERQRHRLEALLRNNTDATWDQLRIPSQHNDLNEWHVACGENWSNAMRLEDVRGRSRVTARLSSVSVVI